jgi:hypothetical protein
MRLIAVLLAGLACMTCARKQQPRQRSAPERSTASMSRPGVKGQNPRAPLAKWPPALVKRDGEPCDDGDPCTLNDTWRGFHCIGQRKVCRTPPCFDPKCDFFGRVDPAEIIAVKVGAGSYQIAANRIEVRVDPATTPAELASFVVRRLNGQIVSQHIARGRYEIRVNAPTKADIDARVASALTPPTIVIKANHCSIPEYY